MSDLYAIQGKGLLSELTSDIVSAYVRNHVVPVEILKAIISDVYSALLAVSSAVAAKAVVEKQMPAVPVRKSLQNDQLTCLECGNQFKSLKRHLMTQHSQTPSEYREKWVLSRNYPMVAPLYAETRSRLAKEVGLGQIRLRAVVRRRSR